MQLLVMCRDERFCDECANEALVELHEWPQRGRAGYEALCAEHLTIFLLERRAVARVAARPVLRAV